jgi:hypothetical protein
MFNDMRHVPWLSPLPINMTGNHDRLVDPSPSSQYAIEGYIVGVLS